MARNPKRQSVETDRVRYKTADEAFRRAFEVAYEIENEDLAHCTAKQVDRCFSHLAPKLRALASRCEALLQVPAVAREDESGIYGHLHAIETAVRTAIDPSRDLMEGELAGTLVNVATVLHISGKDGHAEVVSARARPKDWDPCCPRCGRNRRRDDWNRLCSECRRPSDMARIVGNIQGGGSLIELRKSIPSMSLLEDVSTRRFGHKHFGNSTVAELEAFAREQAIKNGDDADSSRDTFLGMTAAEMVALLKVSLRPSQWDEKTEACYRWVYTEVMSGTPYKQIRAGMKAKFHQSVGSINGVKAIAKRFATALGLEMPSRRKAGRRPS